MSKIGGWGLLLGAAVGITLGAAGGYVFGSLKEMSRAPTSAPSSDPDRRGSYAQQGEDLVVNGIFELLGVASPSYLDIGAHHPSSNNNTYLFYLAGSRGVLVEPNPTYANLLRERRKGDTVVEVGIGISDEAEADYYVIAGDGQRNTFSKEQADELVKQKGRGVLVKVIKRPLVNVNEILAKHFAAAPPDFVSIDVEGLDLAILQTFDFDRARPKVFCVETSTLSGSVNKAILDLMDAKGYAARGGSFVNTVFVDRRALVGKTDDHEH